MNQPPDEKHHNAPDLAGRWPRFAARVIDAVPLLGASFFGGEDEVLSVLYLVAMIVILGIQAVSLSTTGQSIGKKVMAIKVIKTARKADESNYDRFVSNVFLREFVNGVISIIPLYWLIDTLLIFRKDRRCVHDFLAGTRVVRFAEPPPA